jgi:hypothetical protein
MSAQMNADGIAAPRAQESRSGARRIKISALARVSLMVKYNSERAVRLRAGSGGVGGVAEAELGDDEAIEILNKCGRASKVNKSNRGMRKPRSISE